MKIMLLTKRRQEFVYHVFFAKVILNFAAFLFSLFAKIAEKSLAML